MPFAMEQLTQARAIINGVSPQTLNSSRASTSGVDMLKYRRAIFTVYIGTVTAGSISAWLQESSDNFSSDVPSNDAASAFSGSSGLNVSSTANVTSSSIVTFECRTEDLTKGKRYARLQVKEVNGSATIISVVAEGGEAQEKPANKGNGTAVSVQNVVA
jgi:hypothetical protein